MLYTPLLGLTLSLVATSLPATAQDASATGFAVHFRVRTSSEAKDFPAVLTSKVWSAGSIEDYTSNHDLGLSRSSGTTAGWAIALAPNGSWTWNLGDGKRRFDYRPTFERQPLADGKWHHLGFSIDDQAKEARLYHDGREVAVYSIAGIEDWRSDLEVDFEGDGNAGDLSIWLMSEDIEVEDTVSENVPLPREAFASAWEAMSGVAVPDGMAKEPVEELSILAWNIWHGGRRDGQEVGIERVVAAIRESGADAVAMQETYGSGAELADRLGWHFYLRSSNLSVMSRYPIRETFDYYQPFRLGGVTLQLSPGQLVRLFSLWIHHLPDIGKAVRSGEANPAQLVAAEMETRGSEIRDILVALAPVIAQSEQIPLIVAGDFNSPSHLDWIDSVKDRHAGLVVPWPVSTQMAAAGFTDAFRTANPDVAADRGRTWSPRFTDDWQDRIDYVYYCGSALEVIESRMIDHVEPSWPSDHAAVVAKLRLAPTGSAKTVSVDRSDEVGTLRFAIDSREVFVYQYGQDFAIPHIWPLRSPSGKSLLVQKTEPYPHHRSLWIVDRVQLGDGPDTDYYHEWKNLRNEEHPQLGHHSFIRHDRLTEVESEVQDGKARARATAELTWIARDEPVLAQTWNIELEDLGDGEYLLDLAWELRAEYGDVKFLSDWVHYAWPYLRMDPLFNGEHGGVIVDDQGRRGQAGTNEKYARWIDYSNTVEGVTEGVAVLLPDDGEKRKWLTREYGTFGPRRPDAWSGTRFTLKRGERLQGRVGILVHRGDAEVGRVAERHRKRYGARH